jgi:hypothetical protein
MQQLERLQSIIPEVNISYDHLMPKKLSGLYFDNHIKLNAQNDYYKNVEVLGEEIGHHYTSHGHIMDYSKIDNMRQELRARRLGIHLVMPLEKLIECYEHGHWGDIYAMCLHLEIDRSFFYRAIEDYKKQFGSHVHYDGYRIEFEPLKIERVK